MRNLCYECAGSMSWQSLMKPKEAAGDAWPDTTSGAGKAMLKLTMKDAVTVKGSTLQKATAEMLMTGEEFR